MRATLFFFSLFDDDFLLLLYATEEMLSFSVVLTLKIYLKLEEKKTEKPSVVCV